MSHEQDAFPEQLSFLAEPPEPTEERVFDIHAYLEGVSRANQTRPQTPNQPKLEDIERRQEILQNTTGFTVKRAENATNPSSNK